MTEHFKRLWLWFYTELPAYYSIPFIGFVLTLLIGAVVNG